MKNIGAIIVGVIVFVSVSTLIIWLMWFTLVFTTSKTAGQITVGAKVIHTVTCVSDVDGKEWHCEYR